MEITETRQVATDTWMLRFPVSQAYALRVPDGFALIDCGHAGAEHEVLDALRSLGAAPGDPRRIVLTHCHNDHAGAAAALAAATGAAVLAGADDDPVIRGTAPEPPPVLQEWERRLHDDVTPGIPPAPHRPVDREPADGDRLDWGVPVQIVHVPGHTPGSIAVHLPGRRQLFTEDTVASAAGRMMPGVFNVDRARLAESLRNLAALEVTEAFFGHGDPVTSGAGEALRALSGATGPRESP
jgi:glyoxylase-like metal-dependent hydrolase (beta-lactamase superfamily II)